MVFLLESIVLDNEFYENFQHKVDLLDTLYSCIPFNKGAVDLKREVTEQKFF